jgi:hypothetical protein
MDSIPIAALAPIVILVVAFQIYCLWDLSKSSVRYLPKWGWAAAIILLNFGGIVYLLAGKEQH